jgi:hypothetical protein
MITVTVIIVIVVGKEKTSVTIVKKVKPLFVLVISSVKAWS